MPIARYVFTAVEIMIASRTARLPTQSENRAIRKRAVVLHSPFEVSTQLHHESLLNLQNGCCL